MLRRILAASLFVLVNNGSIVHAEVVYVESPVDTDGNGRPDKIYVKIDRPNSSQRLPSIIHMSPYALGGNSVNNHNVDMSLLPQDSPMGVAGKFLGMTRSLYKSAPTSLVEEALARGYAAVTVHSVGTGNSEGCPTIGDEAEVSAGKAVIDWLNGRAPGFTANGTAALANWSNGAVGMTGVSYDGTLPNMIATSGVDGLKAIIPIAAISSWYDYYRANGLVVGPGGYIGEDADILAKFTVRQGSCQKQIQDIARTMGREHGDFDEFWQARDYVSKASQVRAAVFIIHGQSDWNVKQKHASQWWQALDGVVPRRMWLHKGGHGSAARTDVSEETWAWFDRYVKGVQNGVEQKPAVEVEDPAGRWTSQHSWPSEQTNETLYYLNPDRSLALEPSVEQRLKLVDAGKTQTLPTLVANPNTENRGRIALLTPKLATAQLMSGTPTVQLQVAVLNRHAANLTVAVVDYDEQSRGTIITRGWADPQNHASTAQGELLEPSATYTVAFALEPKQFKFAKNHRIGVVLASTDYDYTIRPAAGTEIEFLLGPSSFIKLHLGSAQVE